MSDDTTGNERSSLERFVSRFTSKMNRRNVGVALGIAALVTALGADKYVKSKRHEMKKEVFTYVAPFVQRGELPVKDADSVMRTVEVGYSDVFYDIKYGRRLDGIVEHSKSLADMKVLEYKEGAGKRDVDRVARGYLKNSVSRGSISAAQADWVVSDIVNFTFYPDPEAGKHRTVAMDKYRFNSSMTDNAHQARRCVYSYLVGLVAEDKISRAAANECMSRAEVPPNTHMCSAGPCGDAKGVAESCVREYFVKAKKQ
jgi:hypothetical protein